MLDYDREAAAYDESRGGAARAIAAAAAITELAADGGGACLDVAGGTGIVSAEIARLGFDVVVVDRSAGMLRLASARPPQRVLIGDAAGLPVASGSVDLVVTLWLLHMLTRETAERTVAEVARVLRRGGRWVTSVNKATSHGRDSSGHHDREGELVTWAAVAGLARVGGASFESRTPYGTDSDSDIATFQLAAFAHDHA